MHFQPSQLRLFKPINCTFSFLGKSTFLKRKYKHSHLLFDTTIQAASNKLANNSTFLN
jgi:hypothetical protein